MNDARSLPRLFVLHLGFGGILLLVAGVSAMTMTMSAHTRAATRQVVFESEREAYLIGHIGQQLSRLRAGALDSVANPLRAGRLAATMTAISQSIDKDMDELPPLLSATETASWRALEPQITALRRDIDETLTHSRQDDSDEAWRLLARSVDEQDALALSLERFSEIAHEDTQVSLDIADHRMSLTRNIRAAALALLFAATALIWFRVWRTVKAQQAAIALHISHVESANHDLDAFAGRVAHDLKNVLTPVGLSVPALRRANNDLADRVERASRNAVDILDSMLAFSRAGAPPNPTERATVAVEVDAVRGDLSTLAESLHAAVSVDVDRSLEVTCSPALLHVVLLNLVGNALKYLEGRTERAVKITAHRADGSCQIDVDDTGPGVAPEIRDRIFEPFFRAPGATVGGTGLGLATVRRIVAAYGGTVSVDSADGRGARARVTLPLATAAPSNA